MDENVMIGAVTLDHLRIFIAVAEEGSFSAAARRVGRVQSAISQSAQNLETILAVRLFDRHAKTPRLTDTGRALLVQARHVVGAAEALQAQAQSIASGREAELTIAVDNLFPSGPLTAGLHALQQEFPDLPVTLFTEPIMASERRLRLGQADLALCGLRPGGDGDLVAEPLMLIEMIPVAAAGHPLARAGEPSSREAIERHVQLILTDPAADPDAPSFGVISSRLWRFVELGRRLDFLKAGFGWANMPAHMVRSLIDSGELVALRFAELSLVPASIPISAAYRRRKPPGPAGRWFLDRLIETSRTL